MLITEHKKIYENIFHLRGLLLESVGKSIISDAIKNQEYLYLYYAGDDLTSTGYRIIKPFVLGVNESGNEVIRAWQIEGDSDSFKGKLDKWKRYHRGVRRKDHEFWPNAEIRDTKGKSKKKDIPGWRMLRLDKIKSVYPTGNTFKTEPLPPKYKGAADKEMVSVMAAVPSSYRPEPEKEERVLADKYLKSTNIKRYVQTWYDEVRKIKKRSPSNIIMYINKYGKPDFSIGYGAIKKEKVPEDRIIGNLQELYNEYVLPSKAKSSNWLKEKRKEALKEKKI